MIYRQLLIQCSPQTYEVVVVVIIPGLQMKELKFRETQYCIQGCAPVSKQQSDRMRVKLTSELFGFFTTTLVIGNYTPLFFLFVWVSPVPSMVPGKIRFQ